MRFQSVPARDAHRLVAEGAQLIDVREREEFVAGSLPEAINIPLSELTGRYREINPRNAVALLCRSGARSGAAAEFLADRGFDHVTNLDGGLLAA